MSYLEDVHLEMAKKWGVPRLITFIGAGIDVSPYYEDYEMLLCERVVWEDLEYVLDCMLPVEVTNEEN